MSIFPSLISWRNILVVFGANFVALAGICGQVPGPMNTPNIALSGHDRVYAAEQFSNTVSVIDPSRNALLGVIRLGDPQPMNLSPLYRGQVLVHGLGFSPDHKTLVVVAIASNSVSFIDTASNAVKHTTYLGRAPHEAFYTQDGREVWVTVRGEDYVSVIDAESFSEVRRIKVPNGPGMQIFSPDGQYAYVCSSFNPETVVIAVARYEVIGHVKQVSPFCPNIAATPDGTQVWMTLKDTGKVQVFDARPPFTTLKVLDTGPITNHVNFVSDVSTVAYVTVGGLNVVKIIRTSDFTTEATIPVGDLPHGLWPSGDGKRLYVGLENADAVSVIDTVSRTVIATVPIGQAPQALVYVPNAVPEGDGTGNLASLSTAGQAAHLAMRAVGKTKSLKQYETSVALFDQGLTQVLEASVTGLTPDTPYVLALASDGDVGAMQPLATFRTNPSGAAIVNAVGPIRQVVGLNAEAPSRHLVITTSNTSGSGTVVQSQVRER